MTRETRYNLVFLVVICVLSAPGAIILFRKKMDPNAPAMYLPKPVRQTMAAVDPRPAPDSVHRVLGPLQREWIAGLDWSWAFPGSREEKPHPTEVSQKRTFQLGFLDWSDHGLRVGLVGWAAAATDRSVLERLQFRIASPNRGDGADGRLTASQRIEVPVQVRHELQDNGYILPPADVRLLALEFDRNDSAPENDTTDLILTLRCSGCSPIEEDQIAIPSKKSQGNPGS
ncbi:MAG: hypothetical protein J5J06_04315 [Phycisphaerae bacterium]|nr:hypothetical protein [Phycisphaerae bacterium]